MSTNYTGVETATQSPGAQPKDQVRPIVVLPSDGDALNAASIHQALKILADYVAFNQYRKSSAQDWNYHLQTYMTSAARVNFKVDHYGMPAGVCSIVDEMPYYFTMTGVKFYLGPWAVESNDATNAKITPPSNGIDATWTTPAWKMETLAAGKYVSIARFPTCALRAKTMFTMEWDVHPTTSGIIPDWEVMMGFGDVRNMIAGSDGVPNCSLIRSASPYTGFFFYKKLGQTNWRAWVNNGDGVQEFDLGVAVTGVRSRLKIAFMGSSEDSRATMSAQFYIDGTMKKDFTAAQPAAVAALAAYFGIESGTATSSRVLYVQGPILLNSVTRY
jgi:hypothetical protein